MHFNKGAKLSNDHNVLYLINRCNLQLFTQGTDLNMDLHGADTMVIIITDTSIRGRPSYWNIVEVLEC